MQFARKPRRQPFINIISLIDILVVLLIFYIATTVFKRAEPKLNIVVPPSTTAKSTQDTVPSTIYVTGDSKVYLDDTLVDPDKLGDLLKAKVAANPNFKVAMKADQTAPFKIIVKVMDAANVAHITNLSTYMNTKPAGAAP
jgi:biopolymer transport protein ExbD